MRILAILLALLFVPTLGEAKCRHENFSARVDVFVRESYLIQVKIDVLSGENVVSRRGCLYENVVVREMLCISNYCDTVKIFFKAVCGMHGAEKDEMVAEYSTILFMRFSSSKWMVKSVRERALSVGNHGLVGLIDEYSELLKRFVGDLEEEMASI